MCRPFLALALLIPAERGLRTLGKECPELHFFALTPGQELDKFNALSLFELEETVWSPLPKENVFDQQIEI